MEITVLRLAKSEIDLRIANILYDEVKEMIIEAVCDKHKINYKVMKAQYDLTKHVTQHTN